MAVRIISQQSDNPVDEIVDDAEERQRELHLRRGRHRDMLTIASVVVCLAFLLRVRPDQKIEFFFAPGWTCPETCLSRSLWNFECAGCGLTRSFIHLASGDLKASISIHRVGWLLALATAIQIPYRIFMLRWLRARGLPEPVPRMLNWLVAAVLIAALLVNWLLKLIGI